MKLSDKLMVLASWLENNDELLTDAERNEETLSAVAKALVIASDCLKETSEYVAAREPASENHSNLSPESIDELSRLASELDGQGLEKQASVIDTILLSIGKNDGFSVNFKAAQEAHIDQLKKKYKDVSDKLQDQAKTADVLEEIEKSKVAEKPEVRDLPLSTRHCPDHPGESLLRVTDALYQCPMDKKQYDYENGFTTLKGRAVAGSTLANQSQTMNDNAPGHFIFDTRDERIGSRS